MTQMEPPLSGSMRDQYAKGVRDFASTASDADLLKLMHASTSPGTPGQVFGANAAFRRGFDALQNRASGRDFLADIRAAMLEPNPQRRLEMQASLKESLKSQLDQASSLASDLAKFDTGGLNPLLKKIQESRVRLDMLGEGREPEPPLRAEMMQNVQQLMDYCKNLEERISRGEVPAPAAPADAMAMGSSVAARAMEMHSAVAPNAVSAPNIQVVKDPLNYTVYKLAFMSLMLTEVISYLTGYAKSQADPNAASAAEDPAASG